MYGKLIENVCVSPVSGAMALYNNSMTAYYDFLFTDLAGKQDERSHACFQGLRSAPVHNLRRPAWPGADY
jgi:hypothetical protein